MKLKLAQLQQPIDAAGFPSKSTLHIGTDVTSLEADGEFLIVTTKNGKIRGIPLPNVKYVEFMNESES